MRKVSADVNDAVCGSTATHVGPVPLASTVELSVFDVVLLLREEFPGVFESLADQTESLEPFGVNALDGALRREQGAFTIAMEELAQSLALV